MAIRIGLDADADEISRLLGSYIQSGNINFIIGSGASSPAIATAGNIEEQVNELLADGKTHSADLLTLKFIRHIETVASSLSGKKFSDDAGHTLAAYTKFVATLDKILFERKNLLLPRQANVFTTNYDTFVEHASKQLPSMILNDGFDRNSGVSMEFSFAPERYFDRTYRSGGVYDHYAEIPTINLIKLHGSLSWRKQEDAIVFRTPSKTNSLPTLTVDEKNDEEKVREYLKHYFLILPNLRKFHETLMDRVYYDLLRIYANSMDKENAVLLSFGFSFADEHILDITRRALRNPTSQLIIFSYSKTDAAGYVEKFSKQRNVVVIAPAEDDVIDFSKLNSLLNSVLPS
jgi:hypothetical protein